MDLALSALLASTALLQDKHPSLQRVLILAQMDTQRQEQARLSSRIATNVLLAMEAPHQFLVAPLVDATLAQLAHIVPPLLLHAQPAQLDHIHHLARLHAPRAQPATPPRLQAKLSSRIAMCVLLAMEAPRTLLDPPLAAVPFALWAHIKLLLVTVLAIIVFQATLPRVQARLQPRIVQLALLAILEV